MVTKTITVTETLAPQGLGHLVHNCDPNTQRERQREHCSPKFATQTKFKAAAKLKALDSIFPKLHLTRTIRTVDYKLVERLNSRVGVGGGGRGAGGLSLL